MLKVGIWVSGRVTVLNKAPRRSFLSEGSKFSLLSFRLKSWYEFRRKCSAGNWKYILGSWKRSKAMIWVIVSLEVRGKAIGLDKMGEESTQGVQLSVLNRVWRSWRHFMYAQLHPSILHSGIPCLIQTCPRSLTLQEGLSDATEALGRRMSAWWLGGPDSHLGSTRIPSMLRGRWSYFSGLEFTSKAERHRSKDPQLNSMTFSTLTWRGPWRTAVALCKTSFQQATFSPFQCWIANHFIPASFNSYPLPPASTKRQFQASNGF